MAYIIVLVLYYFNVFLVSKTLTLGLEEGDKCRLRSNQIGYCTNINYCDYAFGLLVLGHRPETCGYLGRTPIVCCTNFTYQSENEQSNFWTASSSLTKREIPTTTTELFKNVTPNQTTPVSFRLNESKTDISAEKCKTFYPKVFAILVTGDGEGGVQTNKEEFKHMAAVGFGKKSEIQWLCGASLISLNFVLTAAHCTYSSELGNASIVRLGDWDISTEADQQEIQDIPIKNIFTHRGYNHPHRYHDIGLLELDYNARWSRFVAPACLDTVGNNWEKELIATGWGRTSFTGDQSNRLLKVDMDVVPFDQCQKAYKDLNDSIQMCAGDGKKKDTCQGDSGGPLQRLDPFQPTWRKVYHIVGITSYGTACGLTANPGVYTRVYPHLNWIENIVWPSG